MKSKLRFLLSQRYRCKIRSIIYLLTNKIYRLTVRKPLRRGNVTWHYHWGLGAIMNKRLSLSAYMQPLQHTRHVLSLFDQNFWFYNKPERVNLVSQSPSNTWRNHSFPLFYSLNFESRSVKLKMMNSLFVFLNFRVITINSTPFFSIYVLLFFKIIKIDLESEIWLISEVYKKLGFSI